MRPAKLSFVIPSFNNLRHLKNAYSSIKKYAPQCEVVILDDGSTDGTLEWIAQLQDPVLFYQSLERVGHTILYDVGISMATNEIVGILHADMIIGPLYVENILKHVERGRVVCATRVEPPLHPPGGEKIIHDFGMDFDSLDIEGFDKFCLEKQGEFADITTKGMFAPWVLYKEDFQSIGGHDKIFAPFPYEDSDIFQRWMMSGLELIQSRDAFCYHLTCRGHRWNEKIGKDDDYAVISESKAKRNYIRKWLSWIQNDEYQCPIISPRYDVGFEIINCDIELLAMLEPWCDNIKLTNCDPSIYINYSRTEQRLTLINLSSKLKENLDSDIIIKFDGTKFMRQDQFSFIQNLSKIITERGEFTYDIFSISVSKLENIKCKLVKNKDFHSWKGI